MKAYHEQQQRRPRDYNEGQPPQQHMNQDAPNTSPHYQAQGCQNASYTQPQGPGNWNMGQQQPEAGTVTVSRSEHAPLEEGVTIWEGSTFTQSQHQNRQLDQHCIE